jgi:crotonobetainyl-CoA:carnitine CoA-transferase CaiB-like acyl-CoA transferase
MKKEEFYEEVLENSSGPLEGYRVLEATTAGAGPWAGTLLADQGAEVIKIDQSGKGDMLRQLPPFVKSSSALDSSAMHLAINRNKKGVTLNFKEPEGQQVFKELAKKMDIIIENFKPGTMEKWHLGYRDIKKIKPDIIYTSVSGYGQYGPYSHKPGYDPVGQAMGGMMSVTGAPDGPPMRCGIAVADNMTGWLGAYGSTVALLYREKTGKGQHVDVNLLDSILYTSQSGIILAALNDFALPRLGNRSLGVVPFNSYCCKDGNYVFILVGTDTHWARLCQILGREDLVDDPRCNSLPARSQHFEFVNGLVNQWMESKTAEEAIAILDEAQLVVGPVYNFKQVIQDQHILERDMVAEIEHPAAGPLKLYGVGLKLSRTPGKVRMPAPMLGQHNEEVYNGLLGLGSERITQLKENGVI